MKAFEIASSKDLMGKLLLKQDFDGFLLEEMELVMSRTYRIDGRIRKEFFGDPEDGGAELPAYEFCSWEEEKPFVTSLIRGKRAPLKFSIVLRKKPEETAAFLKGLGLPTDPGESPVDAFVFTIRFEKGVTTIVSGTSYSTFTMDKEAEKAWDQELERFLNGAGIEYEV